MFTMNQGSIEASREPEKTARGITGASRVAGQSDAVGRPAIGPTRPYVVISLRTGRPDVPRKRPGRTQHPYPLPAPPNPLPPILRVADRRVRVAPERVRTYRGQHVTKMQRQAGTHGRERRKRGGDWRHQHRPPNWPPLACGGQFRPCPTGPYAARDAGTAPGFCRT